MDKLLFDLHGRTEAPQSNRRKGNRNKKSAWRKISFNSIDEAQNKKLLDDIESGFVQELNSDELLFLDYGDANQAPLGTKTLKSKDSKLVFKCQQYLKGLPGLPSLPKHASDFKQADAEASKQIKKLVKEVLWKKENRKIKGIKNRAPKFKGSRKDPQVFDLWSTNVKKLNKKESLKKAGVKLGKGEGDFMAEVVEHFNKTIKKQKNLKFRPAKKIALLPAKTLPSSELSYNPTKTTYSRLDRRHNWEKRKVEVDNTKYSKMCKDFGPPNRKPFRNQQLREMAEGLPTTIFGAKEKDIDVDPTPLIVQFVDLPEKDEGKWSVFKGTKDATSDEKKEENVTISTPIVEASLNKDTDTGYDQVGLKDAAIEQCPMDSEEEESGSDEEDGDSKAEEDGIMDEIEDNKVEVVDLCTTESVEGEESSQDHQVKELLRGDDEEKIDLVEVTIDSGEVKIPKDEGPPDSKEKMEVDEEKEVTSEQDEEFEAPPMILRKSGLKKPNYVKKKEWLAREKVRLKKEEAIELRRSNDLLRLPQIVNKMERNARKRVRDKVLGKDKLKGVKPGQEWTNKGNRRIKTWNIVEGLRSKPEEWVPKKNMKGSLRKMTPAPDVVDVHMYNLFAKGKIIHHTAQQRTHKPPSKPHNIKKVADKNFRRAYQMLHQHYMK